VHNMVSAVLSRASTIIHFYFRLREESEIYFITNISRTRSLAFSANSVKQIGCPNTWTLQSDWKIGSLDN